MRDANPLAFWHVSERVICHHGIHGRAGIPSLPLNVVKGRAADMVQAYSGG